MEPPWFKFGFTAWFYDTQQERRAMEQIQSASVDVWTVIVNQTSTERSFTGFVTSNLVPSAKSVEAVDRSS
jgi:hypothetical protein